MPFQECKDGGRFICTAEEPWSLEKHGKRAIHPDAVSQEGGDDYDAYKCPHCGKYFMVEVAQ